MPSEYSYLFWPLLGSSSFSRSLEENFELYNLTDDLGETNNLAKSNKKVNAVTRKQNNRIKTKEYCSASNECIWKTNESHLVFQMVEELKGILLEAAEDMKPSFHPNRQGIVLLNLETSYFMRFV